MSKTGRLASVLYRPPGASRFASRHAWRGRVGYQSQFLDTIGRAHYGHAKIRRKLGDPEADFPPKPKWMRWRTYEGWQKRFDERDEMLNQALLGYYRRRWPQLKALS